MSFEAFKRQENHVFCTFFKTIVTGTERFEMLYLIDIQSFIQKKYKWPFVSVSVVSVVILRVSISLYLYVTIYILDIYIDIRKSVYHIFLIETTETERLVVLSLHCLH